MGIRVAMSRWASAPLLLLLLVAFAITPGLSNETLNEADVADVDDVAHVSVIQELGEESEEHRVTAEERITDSNHKEKYAKLMEITGSHSKTHAILSITNGHL